MDLLNRKILIVDDAANWRTTLETVLKSSGFEVRSASTVMEAYQALLEETFAAAILDVRLDTMEENIEGITTVLNGAHRHDPRLGFVVISSYYSEEEVKSMVPEGVSVMYVDKNNFRIDDLMAALDQLSRSKHA